MKKQSNKQTNKQGSLNKKNVQTSRWQLQENQNACRVCAACERVHLALFSAANWPLQFEPLCSSSSLSLEKRVSGKGSSNSEVLPEILLGRRQHWTTCIWAGCLFRLRLLHGTAAAQASPDLIQPSQGVSCGPTSAVQTEQCQWSPIDKTMVRCLQP